MRGTFSASCLPVSIVKGEVHFFIFVLVWRLCSLTLGLMGLDELHLRVLATSSDEPKERNNAKKGAAYCPSNMLSASKP